VARSLQLTTQSKLLAQLLVPISGDSLNGRDLNKRKKKRMKCQHCKDTYTNRADRRLIIEYGLCIHCAAETQPVGSFAKLIKKTNYPIKLVLEFFNRANS
jgi:hypothetical protein